MSPPARTQAPDLFDRVPDEGRRAGVEALSILIEVGDAKMRAATAVVAHWEGTHREARIIEMSKAGGAS